VAVESVSHNWAQMAEPEHISQEQPELEAAASGAQEVPGAAEASYGTAHAAGAGDGQSC